MTEHDAPTVARATLWLDTSAETNTRRTECLEDSATLIFERPPVPLASSEPQPVTMALDRESAFAAFEASATSTFVATDQPPVAARRWRVPWRSITSHAMAMAVGAASVACILALGRSHAPSRAAHTPEPRAEQAAKHDAPVAAPHLASAIVPASTDRSDLPPAAPIDATLSGAVDALARGDYAQAHALYAALAVQRPHDAALVTVATILADRIEARCASDGQKEAACAL